MAASQDASQQHPYVAEEGATGEAPAVPLPRRPAEVDDRGTAPDRIAGPRLPRVYVPRRRLWEQLDNAADCAVTLVVAPAGAGKTLGAAGWLRGSPHLGADAAATVWVQGDETWGPERLAALLSRMRGRHGRRPARIVVDDAHLLPAATHRLLNERLGADPESMRLLLLSRWDLPFSRLVPELLGHLVVIRGNVLRMTDDEAEVLIVEHARTGARPVVEAITQHAHGWCAALVLAARAVGASPNPVEAARQCTVGQMSFGDRIAAEVFASLPARVRHLLLCVTAEGTVTAQTAAHLSQDRGAGDVLTDLESTGLLVARVSADVDEILARDGQRDADTGAPVAYRIHPLLVEVVRRRLATDGVDVLRARATVVRAVQQDAALGDIDNALRRLAGVRAFDECVAFLSRDGVRLVLRGAGAAIALFAREHPERLEDCPEAWFALAIERWVSGDAATALTWLGRCRAEKVALSDEQIACMRLMRARSGLEASDPAAGYGAKVALASAASGISSPSLALLLYELGVTDSWLGDLPKAEVHLSSTIGLAHALDLPGLALSATSHLALTQHMLGRERGSAEVVARGRELVAAAPTLHPQFTTTRLALAEALARSVDVPWTPPRRLPSARVHQADLTTRFWLQIHQAHAALTEGQLAESRRLLEDPLDLPEAVVLPDHLRAVLLVERAALAALAGDRPALKAIEEELEASGLVGETAFAGALRADLDGDRRLAARLFEVAAEDATYSQPVTRSIALVARAQLLDELGEQETAHACLEQAVIETEVRRNAAPFLGWVRQGTPIQTMLSAAAGPGAGAWIGEIAEAVVDGASIATYFASATATTAEETGAAPASRPVLSAREREVLHQLSRGSTYADISASLFLSENTVKTHVSNLYAKLGVARRSEALAVGRSLHLI